LGELTALPQISYLDLRGPTSNGGAEKGRGRERGGNGKRKRGEERGKGRKGKERGGGI